MQGSECEGHRARDEEAREQVPDAVEGAAEHRCQLHAGSQRHRHHAVRREIALRQEHEEQVPAKSVIEARVKPSF